MDGVNPFNPAQRGVVPEAGDTSEDPKPAQEPQATQQSGQPALQRLTGGRSASAPRPVSPAPGGGSSVLARLSGQLPANPNPPAAVQRPDSAALHRNSADAKEQLAGFGFTSAQIEAMSRSGETLAKAVEVWPTVQKRNTLAGNTHELVARVAAQEGPSGLDALLALARDPMHQFHLAERVKELGIDGPEKTGPADWQQTNRPV
ncbi:hypothetical protein GWC77_25665 [Paraburkholderia sp. NMBU_R16]|uniref:hypothetical protein n=1 Tax=Paraburkholderia sp. NMBU_R16 TaxID=2698676 RepID=UPI0015670192|nr:hypothetical protein [Paraburkholderia sp. NMBU_R16]NRO99281.1 hypothetical protein [Paraburkholderia sp. NMBU_R16]